MRITCPSCGNASEFSSNGSNRRCDYCGSLIRVASPSQEAVPAQPAVQPATRPAAVVGPGMVRSPTNTLAVIGFVISIAGLFLGWITCGLASFISIISIVLCLIASRREPRGLAVGGVVVSVVGLLPLAFLITMFVFGKGSNKNDARSADQLLAIRQAVIEPETFASFPALNMVPQGAFDWKVSVAEFDADGPGEAASMPTNDEVRQIAFDTERMRYYAISNREFGRLSNTGAFTPISVDDAHRGQMSNPGGVAYLPEEDRLIIFVNRGALYYSEKSAEWMFVEIPDHAEYVAVAYAPEKQLFYALARVRGERNGTFDVVRLNRQLAVTGTVRLSHALPTENQHDLRIQLAVSGDRLILVIAPHDRDSADGMRLLSIDPESGDLAMIARAASSVGDELEAKEIKAEKKPDE